LVSRLCAHEIISPRFRDSERDSKPNSATLANQFVPLPKENQRQRLHIQPHFGSDLISKTLKETPTGLARPCEPAAWINGIMVAGLQDIGVASNQRPPTPGGYTPLCTGPPLSYSRQEKNFYSRI
jgi:hypothetical protein